jgi:hypothetical protein
LRWVRAPTVVPERSGLGSLKHRQLMRVVTVVMMLAMLAAIQEIDATGMT